MGRLEKIKEVLNMAKELGLSITEEGGISVAKAEPKAEPPPPPSPAPPADPPKQQPPTSTDEMIPTDAIAERPMSSVGGSTSMGAVNSYNSYEVSGNADKLPEETRKGKVKMAVVEGREGQPLAIQEKRVDGTGTTQISIHKNENDGRLQDRFKRMAQDSMNDNVPDFARSGYANTTTTCTFCQGKGTVKSTQGEIECPKCHGSCIISIY
jgi:hypothetical protein